MGAPRRYTLAMPERTRPGAEPVTVPPEADPPAASEQPTTVVELGGTRFTLLGTAHVSRASAEEVERQVASGRYDAVAIELDPGRYAAITKPDRWAEMDLFQVFRQGKAGMMMANLALSAFQQRLADQFGIEPGQEMRVAISAAEQAGLPLLLIDRDIGLTLKRVNRSVSWWRRLMIMSGLAVGVFTREEISEEEIERLKEGDLLEATFTEFAETSQDLYEPLIAERDRYMAARLEEETRADGGPRYREVLVVIGAGHLSGLARHLEAGGDAAPSPAEVREELERVPPPSVWPKLLPWALVAVILAGFALGFARSPDLGVQLLSDWVLLNGGLAALGGIAALGHPLTVLVAFLAAPITSLNPFLGVGFVAVAVELWLRKPTLADFSQLRHDVTTARGWWRNRAARAFLVFLLTTLGSAAGTFTALPRFAVHLFG